MMRSLHAKSFGGSATTFAANLSFAQLASDLNRRHPKDGGIKELA